MRRVLPSFAVIFFAQVSFQQIINTDFTSAVDVNVCQERDGGYGPGRVTFETRSCECLSANSFRAYCHRTRPNPREGFIQRYERRCDPRDPAVVCLPTDDSRPLTEDCMCKRPAKKMGSKAPFDADGVACSGGISIGGRHAAAIWSSIVFTQPGQPSKLVQGCWVQDNKLSHLASNYPCVNNGHKLHFEARNTYQACIETNDDIPQRINFDWIVTSPFGHRKRDGLKESFVEQIHYNASYATGDWGGSIVLIDGDGVTLKRFNI